MNSRFHSRIRSGLIALGVLAGLCAPAAATQLAGASRAALAPAIAETSADVSNVTYRRYRCYDRYCGGRYGRGHFRYNYYNNDWRYRRYNRRYYNSYPGFDLGLGVPAYRYDAQPRRYYGGGSAMSPRRPTRPTPYPSPHGDRLGNRTDAPVPASCWPRRSAVSGQTPATVRHQGYSGRHPAAPPTLRVRRGACRRGR